MSDARTMPTTATAVPATVRTRPPTAVCRIVHSPVQHPPFPPLPCVSDEPEMRSRGAACASPGREATGRAPGSAALSEGAEPGAQDQLAADPLVAESSA